MESPLDHLILFACNGVSIRLPDSFFVMRARLQLHWKKNQALLVNKIAAACPYRSSASIRQPDSGDWRGMSDSSLNTQATPRGTPAELGPEGLYQAFRR